jgi:hypothetical protein
MQTVAKRSRFSVASKGVSFRITRNDLDILGLLQTYKYLPSTYIAAFLHDAHPQYIKNRLTILRHEAKVIDCPASSWHAANARYRPAVYQLTEQGREVLTAHGRYRPTHPTSEEFKHEFGVCITAASFALGAMERSDLNFYSHEAICNSKHCPASTRQSKTPFQIPITFMYHYVAGGQKRHKELATYVKHDWKPFGFTNPSKPKAQIFFPGIEFDRHTESLDPTDDNA